MGDLGRHLLAAEGLDRDRIEQVMERASAMAEVLRERRRLRLLEGRTVCTAFWEDSTRTRHSFELATKRLSADVLSFSARGSSVGKSEGLEDTVRTLGAMGVDLFVVRHPAPGAAHRVAECTGAAVVNAGDGPHAHPTQALLDLRTILDHRERVEGLTVAIVGDIAHSRVVRSNLHCLRIMGARVRVIGPPTLIPQGIQALGAEVFDNLEEGLRDADVIMVLRMQMERMPPGLLPSLGEYTRRYRIDSRVLGFAAPGALVMHPGPMNRGVEITAEVADGRQSVIEKQVTNGIAVRMAVLSMLLAPGEEPEARGGDRPGGNAS